MKTRKKINYNFLIKSNLFIIVKTPNNELLLKEILWYIMNIF